jgi:hypothetical protein
VGDDVRQQHEATEQFVKAWKYRKWAEAELKRKLVEARAVGVSAEAARRALENADEALDAEEALELAQQFRATD